MRVSTVESSGVGESGRREEGEERPAEKENGESTGLGGEGMSVEELRARLGMRETRIRELYEEISRCRLAADEARAALEVGLGRVEDLESERDRLRERIRDLEEQLRERRRRREGLERRISRLERELQRKDAEISRRDQLLERGRRELEGLAAESEETIARKDRALAEALSRVEGLERDLEERENEVAGLRATIEELRGKLEEEYELRRRLAEPANRLRAGIELFNDSEHRRSMNALSRTLGQPEVHVELDEGEEPPVILTFTWQGVTWQSYSSNPGLAVEEPRV
ncbi:MAG: hypothetical protein AB1425_01770, partial [Actinomycetota bacterium]